MLGYIIASFVYVIATRFIGTPFKDSLTKEQLRIKKESSLLRMSIFLFGVLVACIFLYLNEPFEHCKKSDTAQTV